jgi:hypothetical protein
VENEAMKLVELALHQGAETTKAIQNARSKTRRPRGKLVV